ncbi:MAG: HAE1 family hydrophobic/amphiphilic exporter-1, partial [Phycisphaerales bacterium]
GLEKMTSNSSRGGSSITLEFVVGHDIALARLEVADALRQVSGYPDEVDEPVVQTADGDSSGAIAWLIIDLPEEAIVRHAGWDITTLFDELEDEVKPFLERIDGVASVHVYGGREREVRVMADPVRLAERQLHHGDLLGALRGENRNVSAGSIAEGKRDYTVRLVGEYTTPDQVLDTVIAYRDGRPVLVRDVAEVEETYVKRSGFVRAFGHPSIAMPVNRETGSNVVEIMDQVRTSLDEIRARILPNLGGSSPTGGPVGPDLRLRQVYDETLYIDSAMSLVTRNLYVGGTLAGLVLLLFLRSLRPTLIVLLSIPISVIGTFLVLLAMDRTLNIISLAGLAFAVGMVVDNAIVVLENIYRRLELGDSPMRAAWVGGKGVWGAVLASTLTTAAVFIPVLTIQGEAGQLFRDIALAIVASVLLSLIVSITVIPCACSRLLSAHKPHHEHNPVKRAWTTLFGLTAVLQSFDARLGCAITWLVSDWRGWTIRPAVILVMTAASLVGAALMIPPMDYLPQGNRNLVFGGLLIPPGLSVAEKERIAQTIERQIVPYARADINDPESMAGLDPIKRSGRDPANAPEPFAPMAVENFFIGAFGPSMFCGATSQNDQIVIPVGQLVSNAMQSIPDTFGGASQSSLFGRGAGGGGTIDIEISGPDLARVTKATEMILGIAGAQYGFGRAQPSPANYALPEQEMQVRLNDRGRELGLSTEGLGVAIRALFDGAYVGDYKLAGDTVDLVVMPTGGRLANKEMLAEIPIYTPAGAVVPVDEVVDFIPTLAPQSIMRIEELGAVTVSIRPPEDAALEDVMAWLQTNAIEPTRKAGLIDRTMRVNLEGTAAKLDDVKAAMFGGDSPRTFSELFKFGVPGLFVLVGLVVGAMTIARGFKKHGARAVYGSVGAVLLAVVLGGLAFGLLADPSLVMARFVWALLVTYLLMAALFESWIDPFVIMFSVPLAVVGGFAGLRVVHEWTMADPTKAPQQLDVLTMLGFVILIGVVVNNAILIVHQALNFMRGLEGEPMSPAEAISASVRTRLRPIFMSVLTSVGGMLPLVLFPGSGSEMYRGLGSVVVGGLVVSTVFTLVLVPLLFSLVVEMRRGFTVVWTGCEVRRGGTAEDWDAAPAEA